MKMWPPKFLRHFFLKLIVLTTAFHFVSFQMFQVQMSSIWVENIPHFSFHGESGRGLGISGMAGPPPKPEGTERVDLRPHP